MKTFTFRVVIREGSDEFWESKPSDKEVTTMLIDIIEDGSCGALEVIREGGYKFATTEVTLVKMENE